MDNQNGQCDLVARSRAILGSDCPVIAAGIFGLKDTFATEAFASLAGAQTGKLLAAGAQPTRPGQGVAVHATRHATATLRGLSVRMLVAVTPSEIHILDWSSDSGPTRVLMSFDRATTDVAVHRFGLHRTATLHDRASGRIIPLTGTRARVGATSHSDRSVLATLAASA